MTQIEVEYINHCGDDLSVVDAARTSFDKQSEWEFPSQFPEKYNGDNWQEECLAAGFQYNELGGLQRLKSSDTKLINYLAKHKHLSPFNHSFISVRVKAPVFVARQLVKHKFMPWNEVSRRYVKGEVEFYKPDYWRKASESVKQGSSLDDASPHSLYEFETWQEDFDAHNEECLRYYSHLLEQGVCAEEARMVLPQSMMTTWVWSGTLGAFCDMLRLRLKKDTQLETRIVAEQVAEIVEKLFPVSYKALLEGN